MHVTSALATGATAYSFPHTGGKAGGENIHATTDSAEQNAKQQATAGQAAERKLATEAAKSNRPLHVSDYGYSGVLNTGQMTIILLEDYNRKMDALSEEIEAETERAAEDAKRREQAAPSQTDATSTAAAVTTDAATATTDVDSAAGASDATDAAPHVAAPVAAPDDGPSSSSTAQAVAQTYQHRAETPLHQNLAMA